MCGIAGFVNVHGQGIDPAILDSMTDSLAHRGPDSRGTYTDQLAGLGHRRLAIIDLSTAGQQPMSNEDQTIWLVYNGEIYNHEDLRRVLKDKGHWFCSATDSEVILHAYEEWGVECLPHFNGMFAFAIWDSRKNALFLARDRLGIKPLFYAFLPGKLLAFASEMKGILAHPAVPRVLEYTALSHYLALNYTPAPHTLLRDVRQLLPGEYGLMDREGDFTTHRYWDIQYAEDEPAKSANYYLEELESELSRAVNCRLMSDVPYGAFLSGGLDSSTIVYWMSKQIHQSVKTFSIDFSETGHRSYDESTYALQVARFLGTDHHQRHIDVDLPDLLPRLIWHAEEPTADSSMVGVFLLSEFARQDVTMALSGDGADEILAGYETYQAFYVHRLYRNCPTWLRDRLLPALIDYLPVSTAKVSWDFKLRRFLRSGCYTSEDAHAIWRQIFSQSDRQALLQPVWDHLEARSDIVDVYRSYFRASNARHPLNRMLYVDTRFYLPNDMLVKVDRMSMAHGLEVRVPFLDHRLVEYAARVPTNLKLRFLWQRKYLLKRMMQEKLPEQIIWRKKAGFNMPVAAWLKGPLKTFMQEHLSKTRIDDMGFLNYRVVEAMIDAHLSAQADNSHQLWGLLMLSLWWQSLRPEDIQ